MDEEKKKSKKILVLLLLLLLVPTFYITINNKKTNMDNESEEHEKYDNSDGYDYNDENDDITSDTPEIVELDEQEIPEMDNTSMPSIYKKTNKRVASDSEKKDYNANNNSESPKINKLKLSTEYSRTIPTYNSVTVTITSNKKLKQLSGWTLSEDGLTLTKEYEVNAKEKIKVTDTENHQEEVNISINNIFSPSDEKIGEDGQFVYVVLPNGKIQIIRYIGTATNITIPYHYDGYTVYSIGNLYHDSTYNIFGEKEKSNTTVKSIIIEEGIKNIERCAFINCTGLTGNLIIPEGIEKIGYGSFYGCTNINGTLTLPSTLKVIDDYSFAYCSKLTGSIVIPEGVEKIGFGAFNNCKKLNGTLTLPSTLKVIDEFAFGDCTALTGNLIFPEGLTYIGKQAFNKCGNLTGDLIIPEGVTYIGRTAFQLCSKLNGTLYLPSTLTYIGDYAFSKCSSLKGDINIPEGVTYVGEAAFNQDSGFNGYLTLPSTLETIGNFAFNQCLYLKNEKIVIPKSVKTIGISDIEGTHVFYATAQLSHKEFEVSPENKYFKAIDGVLYTKDGSRMVDYPSSKPGEVYEIPEGILYMDQMSFGRNQYLKKVILPDSYTLSTTIPTSFTGNNASNTLSHALYKFTTVEEIAVKSTNQKYKTIDGILYSKDGKELWYIPIKKEGTITIPEGVETIKNGGLDAPYHNANISVIIPNTVTTIEPNTAAYINSIGPSRVIFEEEGSYYFNSNGVLCKKN